MLAVQSIRYTVYNFLFVTLFANVSMNWKEKIKIVLLERACFE